jgi:glucans biosynthesis protein
VRFEDVKRTAEGLAARPYEPPPPIPGFLRELRYDAYRDIRFAPAHSVWRGTGSPFEIQLFHVGLFFDRSVAIHVVSRDATRRLPFSQDLFDYGSNRFPEALPEDLGFAGFRLHYPLNRADYLDEAIVFLGASYFRAVPAGLRYGLSARGLALDTATGRPEEFPWFRAFWIQEPEPGARSITVLALLDSPSVAGAYRFVVSPGDDTVVEVLASLFVREKVERFGVAPLTSMFWHGENSERHFGDFRPEVHDSDGLLIAARTGEWIWRPLTNPPRLAVSLFRADTVRGFGLVQRDRDFRHHEDLEARYDLRPSTWVEPLSDFGPGGVALVEIPSQLETDDNVVAFFVPDPAPKAGDSREFAYRLHWFRDAAARPPGGRNVATRFGVVHEFDPRDTSHPPSPRHRRIVLDFEGEALAALGPEEKVEAVISASGGSVGNPVTYKNDVTGGWRTAFEVRAEPDRESVELRCFLAHQGDALTETWSYRWTPE